MSRRSNGEGCNPSYFRDKFKVTLTAIEGVRVLTPHSCRHTYVSQLQALGVDLSTIQSLVGHVDTDMTQRDRTADLLNAILAPLNSAPQNAEIVAFLRI